MLRPIDADVHLKYICGECGSTMWASITEARTPNFILVCGECNAIHKLVLVGNINISFVKVQPTTKVFADITEVKIKEEMVGLNDIVIMLANLGHDKKKAKLLVQQGVGKGLKEDELIKWCLTHSA